MLLADINNLCTQLQIKCLNRPTSFSKNTVLKAFTVALDILQGKETCFYGMLQPTLEVLMAKILTMKHGLLQMTTGLPEIIVGAINQVNLPQLSIPVMHCWLLSRCPSSNCARLEKKPEETTLTSCSLLSATPLQKNLQPQCPVLKQLLLPPATRIFFLLCTAQRNH